MDGVITYDLVSGTNRQFVTEADWIPGFWNYLLDLDRDDLVAELIQNDLDQDATRTVISFEEDRLICEGNGRPVEAEGWQRLRKIQGAGDSVPTKRRKIGVKNHGLKTAFTIGDELQLMSAGLGIIQTLYAKGRNEAPYPGASAMPIADPLAPANGCRVTIWYRNESIRPSQGEANILGPVSEQEIDELFLSACANTPEQFAGIVSPEVVPNYEIVLRHCRLGEARFRFSCTKPHKIAKRIEVFRRRCRVSGTVTSLPKDLQEQAARRLVPLKGRLRQRVADFFRRDRYFFVEVSWPTNQRGKPRIGIGRFRYPIGYPKTSHEARTGHGVNFNAPIASDNKRHGPARNEATNEELGAACELLLTDVLARYTIPRWGPDGLNLLIPSPSIDNYDKTIRPLLAALARQGALPLLNWRTAAELVCKGKRQEVNAVARRLAVRKNSMEERKYRFVIPVTTWKKGAINPTLSLLCPRSEMQLDPRTHTDIVRLLADYKTPGFNEDFTTFDENDVFSRVMGEGNEYFSAIADPQREFAEPLIVRSYLDLIKLALDEGKCDHSIEESLMETLLIPDIHAQATSLRELYYRAPLPSDVPGLRLPPVMHLDIVAHPLLKRRKWHRPKYTMAQFLEDDTLRTADEDTRRLFWKWLSDNAWSVAPRERPKLADLAIWPDENGSLCRISDLCDPRSQRIGEVLVNSIRRPHPKVRNSKLVSTKSRARTSIRRVPTKEELVLWLDTRLAGITLGETPDAAIYRELIRFEADLTILCKDIAIARLLKATEFTLPALAQDGSIQPRTALVMPGRSNDRLALLSRFLLKEQRHVAVLDKLSPSLSVPTTAMLLDTLSEDPTNFSFLQARLQHLLSITEPNDEGRRQLADMPILPVRNQPRAPMTLAFTGNRGDYWGTWKTRVSGKGLSQEDQDRYRAAGVTSELPNLETSRAFFEWLCTQKQAVLEQHMPCVLRHILHPDGPTRWAKAFTDTPFIPAAGQEGLRLVSLRMALRKPVYLPDAGDLGDAVIGKDSGVLLIVDHVKEVVEPISERLCNLGIRSLREALKEPVNVTGAGDVVRASDNVLAGFGVLQSFRFRRTLLKRLNELGVESDLVRRDWYHRLGWVKDIHFADEVHAQYRLRGKTYLLQVDAGFDPTSNNFWMKRDRSIGLSSLYESIARQLVFKPGAKPIHLLALERALSIEINDPSYGRLASGVSDPKDDNVITADADRNEYDDNIDVDPGEAVFGHSPFEPDKTRNSPTPSPIHSNSEGAPRRSVHRNKTSSSWGNEGPPKDTPELEREHIETLKTNHYASHCQMCLCERLPQDLAPIGSYIEWEEVRRRIMEAHHVDLKSAGGARHAGNLLLLCTLHHNNFGRRLTRAAVTAALRANTKDKMIDFGVGSKVNGRQIELVIPDTGEVVELFFTNEHAIFWLSHGQTSD